jgi:hypothetical protein
MATTNSGRRYTTAVVKVTEGLGAEFAAGITLLLSVAGECDSLENRLVEDAETSARRLASYGAAMARGEMPSPPFGSLMGDMPAKHELYRAKAQELARWARVVLGAELARAMRDALEDAQVAS